MAMRRFIKVKGQLYLVEVRIDHVGTWTASCPYQGEPLSVQAKTMAKAFRDWAKTALSVAARCQIAPSRANDDLELARQVALIKSTAPLSARSTSPDEQ